MKKLFLLLCLLTFTILAQATNITVSSFQKTGYNYGGTTATIRVYASQNFLTNDGQSVTAGAIGGPGFYQTISCTISGTTLNVPSFTVVSTDDAQPNTARFSFILYDHAGVKRDTLYSNYRIPTAFGTTITIAQLITWNTTASQPPRPGFPDTVQVQQLINAAGPVGFASDVIYGKVKLDVAPASSVNPIAIGANSPLLTVPLATTSAYGRTSLSIAPTSALNPIAVSDNDSRLMYVTPYQYGALGDGTGATISSADVTAHGVGTDYPWAGTYTVGTDTLDFVGLQEAIYAAFYSGTLTPNKLANVQNNKELWIPQGNYKINRRLQITLLIGGHIRGAGRFTTHITQMGANQSVIRTNGMGYSVVSGIHFDSTANLSNVALFELDWDNTSGGGALQSNTFWDDMFDGQHATVDFGLRIGNTGFMGSENLVLNSFFNTFQQAAIQTANANALQNTVVGGNIAGCPLYGIWVRQGSAFVYSVGFQNGIKAQIDDSGSDMKVSNSVDGHSSLQDSRSESGVMLQSSNGHRMEVRNNVMRTDVTVWSASQNYGASDLVTGTTTSGNGRMYIVVNSGTSGTVEPTWTAPLPNANFTVTGAMILATPTLTAASGFFPSGIAGQTIVVPGAGFAGSDLITTIVSRDSGTQLTLTANASTTVSNKVVHWATPITVTGGTATFIPYDFAQLSLDNGEVAGNTFKLGYLDISGNSMTLSPIVVRSNSFPRVDMMPNLSGGLFLNDAIPIIEGNVVHIGGGRNLGKQALTKFGQMAPSGTSKLFAGSYSQVNFGQNALLFDGGVSAVAAQSQGFFRATLDTSVNGRNMVSVIGKLGGLPATGTDSNVTAFPSPFDSTDLFIAGGMSTGSATGGTIHLQVSAAGSSGTTLNTPADMLTIAPGGVAIGGGTNLTKVLRGTVTIDPASINATTVSSQTFTLTGAATGDTLVLNPPAAGLTAGLLVCQAFVSSSNTVTIVLYNTTGSPIDEASSSWNYYIAR